MRRIRWGFSLVALFALVGGASCDSDGGGGAADVAQADVADENGQGQEDLVDVAPLADVDAVDQEGELPGDVAVELDNEVAEPDVCVPDCAGKTCGSDGCGGICGSCSVPEACDEATGHCMDDPPNCSGKECGPDGFGGLCGLCLEGEECDDQGQCVPGPAPECEYCAEPYPICVQLDGLWSCVQCADDSHCGEGMFCDLTSHSCRVTPAENAGVCDESVSCIAHPEIQFQLECELDLGRCYDKHGWCDGAYATCRPGSSCIMSESGFGPIISGGTSLLPVGGTTQTVGLCSCSTPLSTDQLLPCFGGAGSGTCVPSTECPGAQQCVSASLLAGSQQLSDVAGLCLDLTDYIIVN